MIRIDGALRSDGRRSRHRWTPIKGMLMSSQYQSQQGVQEFI
jgi:hypothetical protein